MSNYTKTTNFAAKDSLPSGNAAKIVKGTEIDTEFNNIATASATKANTNNAALTGTTTFETISDGTIAITAFVDEDNMASDSATLLPTQQSVKAYVDSQVTAQDLDVTDGSTSIDIDLDSESLGILGGTGIDSTASGTGVTLAIDSTVATLTGSQTLSNKTLSTPVVSGNLTTDGLLDGRDVAADGTKLDGIESGATADQTAAEIKTAYESNANTNAFTDADESKLDGIEASADVTDTANVTAAGALMDSELTSEASVKALNQGVATTDSPTFAGVTAPVTGNVTGNLTGNVTGDVTGDLTGDVTGNVTGNLTGTILTAAQTNITSVGELGSLVVGNNLTTSSLTVAGSNLLMTRQASGFDPSNVFTVISNDYKVGVRTGSPAVTLDLGSATDAVHVPTGTTAQRPTGAAGYFRYNSTLEQFEGYTDAWGAIGGGGTNTFTTDSFTGDGSTAAYALSQSTASEDNLLVFIEGVFQQQDAYSIATAGGVTTLTFSSAPANGNSILIYSVAAGVSGSNLNIDSMTGDGSDTTLTLSINPVNENNTQVFIDGVYQSKSNYSISGTTLTFSTAPPTGSAVEVMTMTQTDINVPVDGTITSAKLSGDLVTPGALDVTGTVTADGLTVANTSVIAGDFDGGAAATYIRLQDDTDNFLFGSNNSLGNFLIKNETADALRLSVANNGDISFYEDTGTTAKLFWDASAESLGIGTTSPSAELDVVGATAGSGSAETVFRLSQPANTLGANNEIRSGVTSGTSPYLSFAVRQSASPYATVERMRIDSSGNLLVAQTALNYNAVGSSLASNGTLRSCVDGGLVAAFNRKTSDGAIVNFYKNGTTVGSISTNANSLPSDRNFKTNIQDLSLGLNFISSLEPVTYNYKIDEDGAPVMAGLIAQDVEIALAAAGVEANSMTLLQHNPTEDEKESDYQMDYLKLVPVLINAVKELTERLEQLENN
jgi:cytoskeletal protein CcmA (bactofilin family)